MIHGAARKDRERVLTRAHDDLAYCRIALAGKALPFGSSSRIVPRIADDVRVLAALTVVERYFSMAQRFILSGLGSRPGDYQNTKDQQNPTSSHPTAYSRLKKRRKKSAKAHFGHALVTSVADNIIK